MSDSNDPPSWYAATAAPRPLAQPLTADTACDVAVIGGGFTGLTAALSLAERGYDVALLESRRIGWGASGRSGGQIVTGYNRPMAAVAGLVGREDTVRLWDMAEEAKRLLADRVARHAIDCDLRWGYLLAATKRRHLADLREILTEAEGYGYTRASLLDRAETAAAVASPRYLGALLDGGAGHLHPLNYALGLAEAATGAGVRLYEHTPADALELGDPARVRTPHGAVKARYVVLAGNAYLSPLAPEVRRQVRPLIMPVATFMIATEPLGEARAAALIPSDAAVADLNFVLNYYRRSSDHRLLFGGGVSYSTLNGPALALRMKRTMVHFFPVLADAGIDYCWGGNVAITINRLPSFGRVAPNVFFAHGFSGHGVALTGLAGTVMAEAVAGTAERFDVFARLPHRPFPGGRWLRMPALVLAMLWYRLRDLL